MIALAVIGQVLVSILAVFGLIFIFRAVFDWFFAPAAMTVAITVNSKKDADDLDILLEEAGKSPFRRRGVPTIVLIPSVLLQGEIGREGVLDPIYRQVIEAYHAMICVLSEKQQPSSV